MPTSTWMPKRWLSGSSAITWRPTSSWWGQPTRRGRFRLEADSIEETIRLNGVAVEMNLQAFRWGRLYVQDRAAAERQLDSSSPRRSGARVAEQSWSPA